MEHEELQVAVQAMVDMVSKRLPTILSTGAYTLGFLLDLAVHGALGHYNLFSIMDELAILERTRPGPSRTKPASQFRGQHLAGLWHKHHFQARFIPQNLRLELRRDKTVERALGRSDSEYITADMISELVHEIVVGNLETRSDEERLTGEWIVFRCEAGRNHYLTLAQHHEGDEVIAARIARYESLDRSTGWGQA